MQYFDTTKEVYLILDSNVLGNLTANNLVQDAKEALAVLIKQPEVDPNKITIIGHSEGTVIASRVAIDNTTKVKNIVLMGALLRMLVMDYTFKWLYQLTKVR